MATAAMVPPAGPMLLHRSGRQLAPHEAETVSHPAAVRPRKPGRVTTSLRSCIPRRLERRGQSARPSQRPAGWLLDDSIVVGVSADPSPENVTFDLDPEGAIASARTDRPVIADLLEAQRWMPWIRSQTVKALPRRILNFLGKSVE